MAIARANGPGSLGFFGFFNGLGETSDGSTSLGGSGVLRENDAPMPKDMDIQYHARQIYLYCILGSICDPCQEEGKADRLICTLPDSARFDG